MKKAFQHVQPRIFLSRGAHSSPQPLSELIRRYGHDKPQSVISNGSGGSITFSQRLRGLHNDTVKDTTNNQAKPRKKKKSKAKPDGTHINGIIAKSLALNEENKANVINALAPPKLSRKARKGQKRALVMKDHASESSAGLLGVFDKILSGGSSKEASTTSSGFSNEQWRDDWGKDVLKPPETSSEKQRRPPPHKQHHPLAYTRRIEGLLPDEQEKVLADIESPSEQKPIATLAHGLDRVLFNPGVHWLQDPRSRVYNFTPWVENIPEVTDFAFERVTGFVKSSMDEDLWALAKKEGRTFAGSTSSLTGMLSHVYFLVSDDRDVDTSLLSRHFQREPTTFTWGQRMPVSVVLNYRDGVYTIDSEKSASDDPDKNVLTWMGTMLEKFLTVPESEFKQYLRSSHVEIEDDGDARREAYRYSKSNSFVMRSQLDCVDKRLPGTGVFDIKTRAAVSIRLDMFNYEENSGYLIRSLHGPIESFEKEYYDLIRSAFLKYSFQARIGNMDGVLVAYHNTARLFGFQYVSLDEMDARLFGGAGRGERVFTKCVRMLERVMEEVITVFPANSVKCTFDTKEGSGMMRVWVEPTEWDEEGTKPIAQLDVETESFLDHSTVRGSRAIAAVESPWLLHWKISRSSLDYADIRENLAATQQRQSRAWALPEDLGVDAMEKKWNEMDFGGKRREEEMKVSKDEDSNPLDSASIADDEGQQIPTKSTFDPMKFKAPSAAVRNLRRLAREGRVETEQNEAEMGEKVLWASTSHIEGVLESQPAESVATHDESSPSGEVEVDYRFESDHNTASAISSLPAEPAGMDCVETTADGDPVPSGSDGIVVEAGLSTTLQPNGGSHASQSGMDR